MLITVDDDVDIEQAQNDIAEAVNGLMSVSENDSDVVSRKSEHNLLDLSLILTRFQTVASTEFSFFSALTSIENDQPDHSPSTVPPPSINDPLSIQSGGPPVDVHTSPDTAPLLPDMGPTHSPPVGPSPTNPQPMGLPPSSPPPTNLPQMDSHPTNAPSATNHDPPPSSPGMGSMRDNTITCQNLYLIYALNGIFGDGTMIGDHNVGGRPLWLSHSRHPLILNFSCNHEVTPSGAPYCACFLRLIYLDPVSMCSGSLVFGLKEPPDTRVYFSRKKRS